MKRDLDLCREIMLKLERLEPNQQYRTTDPFEVEHVRLLHEAGYLDAPVCQKNFALVFHLNWSGHDFVDATRSNDVWTTAKATLKDAWPSVSLDTAKTVCNKLVVNAVSKAAKRTF